MSDDLAVMMTLHDNDVVKHFEDALISVERQTGCAGATRIYLCCDGPLDQSKEKWLTDNSSRLYRLFRNERHRGHAACLNQIIDNLENEAFAFRMDSDDICSAHRFSSQIDYMKRHPELSLIGCQAWDIDEEGEIIAERNYPVDHEDCVDYMMRMNPILHPTFCFRRSILADSSLRYPSAYVTDDYAFVSKLIRHGHKIGNSPERLFYWRLGSDFYNRRRSLKRGLVELKLMCSAIRQHKGVFSPYHAFALMRLIMRLLPADVQRRLYRSGLRERLGGLARPRRG